MSSEYLSKRIIYYDFIRTFAIFGVLACHCFVGLAENLDIFNTPTWFYSLFLYLLREVCVPLFVCLSGALLITKKDSLVDFIKKRFNRVIVPYIFWSLILIPSLAIFQKIPDPTNLILETFAIPPFGNATFLWFVQMILVVYVVIFVLNKLIEKNDIFLKLSLALSIIYIVLHNFNIIPSYPMPYKYIFYSAFAVFGYYLAKYDFSSTGLAGHLKLGKGRISLAFLVISIILYLCELHYVVSMSIGSNSLIALSQFSILNVALVSSVFLFFRFFAESYGKSNEFCIRIIKGNVGKAVISFSLCSYGIYLCHIIVLNFFTHVVELQSYFSPALGITLLLLLTLALSWIIILFMSRMPLLRWFSGIGR